MSFCVDLIGMMLAGPAEPSTGIKTPEFINLCPFGQNTTVVWRGPGSHPVMPSKNDAVSAIPCRFAEIGGQETRAVAVLEDSGTGLTAAVRRRGIDLDIHESTLAWPESAYEHSAQPA